MFVSRDDVTPLLYFQIRVIVVASFKKPILVSVLDRTETKLSNVLSLVIDAKRHKTQ